MITKTDVVVVSVVIAAVLIGIAIGQNIHCLSFLGHHACLK